MANPVWPVAHCPSQLEWRLRKGGVQHRSPFSGSIQSVGFLSEFWEVTIDFAGGSMLHERGQRRAQELAALLEYLAGGVNQIDVWNWVRPQPLGTLRGSPTLKQVTVRGDATLTLNAPTGTTLEAGDLIGAGGQVFRVRAKCVSSSSTMVVPLVNRVRGVIADNAAVTWDKPKLAVVLPDMTASIVQRPGMALGTQVQLVEAFNA